MREQKENRISLRHGEPITWGERGVRLRPDGSPEVVDASAEGLLVHDAHAAEPAHAFALSRMTQEVIGATPMGVFRSVDRPVYDELMAEQISVATGKGEGELAALLEKELRELSGDDRWIVYNAGLPGYTSHEVLELLKLRLLRLQPEAVVFMGLRNDHEQVTIFLDDLGFDGLVITDALEMRGVSGTLGVPEAAVLALAAGADALCLGHDLHEEAVEQVHAAIVGAVRSGRLAEERVAEAAERVAAVGRWASPAAAGAAGRDVGAEAARRALESSGEVAVAGPVLVVELVPEANIAAGEAQHGLAELLPDAVAVRLREAPSDLAALLAQHDGRRLVLVVRDAARHPWQQVTVATAITLRPDALVVETGKLLSVAWVSFKVGALSYGGGFVVIPLMQSDAVDRHHWLTDGQFLDAVALPDTGTYAVVVDPSASNTGSATLRPPARLA